MGKLVWDQVGTRKYEVGVDHGVLYQKVGNEFVDGVAWNGLVDVTTDTESTASNLYSGDVKADIAQGNDEISGTITAYTYPDEFEGCIGATSAIPGFIVRQQAKNYFGISYRTLLGNDVKGQEYGYRIHLIYNALVLSESHTHSTINDSMDGLDMSWDFDTVPMLSEDEDYYPYSELLFDSTRFSSDFMAALENILYGTDTEFPRMPDLDELIDLYTEEEPMPVEWTGYPNELLYPSDTLYPMEVQNKGLTGTTQMEPTFFYGDSFPVEIGAGETIDGMTVTSRIDRPPFVPPNRDSITASTSGIPAGLPLDASFWFSEDGHSFTPKLINTSASPVTINEPFTVTYNFTYTYMVPLNGKIIPANGYTVESIFCLSGEPLVPTNAVINNVAYNVAPDGYSLNGIELSYRFNSSNTMFELVLTNTTDDVIHIPNENVSSKIYVTPIFTYVVSPEGGSNA